MSHLTFSDDIVLVAKSPESSDIHNARTPINPSMNLNKTTLITNDPNV